MVNYKISVIGEVTRPGTVKISNEKSRISWKLWLWQMI